MLSKKMAVSLTSLITIFALASLPVSAFDVKFDAHDISHAGDIQLERAASVVVYVNFGKTVTLADVKAAFGYSAATAASTDAVAAGGKIDILNYHGAVIDSNATGSENTVVIADREVDDRLVLDDVNQIQSGKDYTITITLDADTQLPATSGDNAGVFDKNEHAYKLRLFLPKDALIEADRNAGTKNNVGFHDKIFLVGAEPAAIEDRAPSPRSIALAPGVLIPDAGFTGDTFDIIVTLTEQPKENKLTAADHFDVAEGTASDGVYLGEIAAPADAATGDDTPRLASGRNGMDERYLVTLTPAAKDANLVFKLKTFGDQEIYTYDDDKSDITGRGPNEWDPPVSELDRKEGEDKITVKIKKQTTGPAKTAGVKFGLPKEKYIPAGGYLIVAEDITGSAIHKTPGEIKEAPKPHERTPAEMMYNVIDDGDLPNLETFLSNGGVIGVMGPQPLMITEIMWGSDASLDDPGKSQWIELYNPGDGYQTQDGDNTTYLVFYGPGETPATGIHDSVGTLDPVAGYWSLAGKGQNGRSAERILGEEAAVATASIVSMYRLIDASGTLANGRMKDSWMQSSPPSMNFEANAPGVHIGTPGAMTDMTALRMAEAAKAKEQADAEAKMKADAEAKAAATGTVPQAGAIYVSEIMVDRGNGLPQWLEISNGSRTEDVNLSGWTLTVNNAAADADVSVGGSITFTIPDGTMLTRSGQNTIPSTLLVVTEAGRNDLGGLSADHVLNLWESGQTELILAGVTKRRYSLLSEMAFEVVLAPPAPTAMKVAATATAKEKADAKAADLKAKAAHAAATDMAGNLGADGAAAWALPMGEDGAPRSSLIRAHVQVSVGPAEPEDGKMMDTWRLASMTSFAHPTHIRRANYYGAANDVGTPGYRAGGALPVELSHFRPARDKATGQVVIAWSTQSELNNAGFFIKRSQQRNGEFKVINATMVPGAGTTSEKQFYTYTDTTAQPNVVYYYQIEDVSLDGNRQTLTRGIRLKGHVGAAGKATTLWGELKASHE